MAQMNMVHQNLSSQLPALPLLLLMRSPLLIRAIWHYKLGTMEGKISTVAETFGATHGEVKYWRAKVQDANFHPGRPGGHRHIWRSNDDDLELQRITWIYCKRNPHATLRACVRNAERHGFTTSKMFFSRLFRRWGWSFKQPETKHIAKYSTGNIMNYIQFLLFVRRVPLQRLKFLDESHLVPRGMEPPLLCSCSPSPKTSIQNRFWAPVESESAWSTQWP